MLHNVIIQVEIDEKMLFCAVFSALLRCVRAFWNVRCCPSFGVLDVLRWVFVRGDGFACSGAPRAPAVRRAKMSQLFEKVVTYEGRCIMQSRSEGCLRRAEGYAELPLQRDAPGVFLLRSPSENMGYSQTRYSVTSFLTVRVGA